MTNPEIELIREFMLVNGQRIEGGIHKRQSYNMDEKQIKCNNNCIIFSFTQLTRSKRASLLVKRLFDKIQTIENKFGSRFMKSQGCMVRTDSLKKG